MTPATSPVAADGGVDPGSRLVAQLIARRFLDEAFERVAVHLHHALVPAEVHAVFDIDEFDGLVTGGGLTAPHLDIVSGGRKIAAPFLQSPSPGTDVAYLLRELAVGSTLRVAHLENHMPSVLAFCRCIEAWLERPVRANLYLTPRFSQGFKPHYDLDDIFVVQVAGSKRWLLHDNFTDRIVLPNRDQGFDAVRHRPQGMPSEMLLETGDVAYLPRGFMHEAQTDDDYSIHITFAVIGLDLGHFLLQAVRQLAGEDGELRRSIAFGPASPPTDERLDALAARLRERMNALLTPAALRPIAEAMVQALAQHRNADLRGSISAGLANGFKQQEGS